MGVSDLLLQDGQSLLYKFGYMHITFDQAVSKNLGPEKSLETSIGKIWDRN